MSLLREIQEAAIDSTVSLSTLLRMCKVLAARLGNTEFKSWIDSELNGYQSLENLPTYRILKVHSKGHFSGPFQSGLRNADIPLMCMPERFRDKLSHSYLTSPVAALESLVSTDGNGTLSQAWDPDFVAAYGGEVYEDMHCMQAWKVIPTSQIVAALDTIRTRVLNFVLEIEAEAPGAGEAPVNSTPLPPERVNQIFNTFITGNVQNLANASPGATQNATYQERDPELFRRLLEALETSNVEAEAKVKLASSVRDMAQSTTSDSFRDAYCVFMSTVADHIQVLGFVVAPFLPMLAALA